MKYTNAVESYLSSCKSSGKSKTTLEGYGRTLRFLGDYCAANGIENVNDITPANLADWKNAMSSSVSSTTLRLYVSHIHSFFEFCEELELIEKTPFKKAVMKVIVKESDKTDSKVLDEIALKAIITNKHPKNMLRKAYDRNRAILLTLITSGMRNSSLRTLRLSDLDFDNHSIRIENAKGGKNGYVLFADVAQNAVRKYLESGIRPSSAKETDPLFGFVNKEGEWQEYSREALSNVVESAVRGFVGVEGVRSHALRHSMASILSGCGMSDREISLLLMHSDGTGCQVTNRYIERDFSELFDTANSLFNKILISAT